MHPLAYQFVDPNWLKSRGVLPKTWVTPLPRVVVVLSGQPVRRAYPITLSMCQIGFCQWYSPWLRERCFLTCCLFRSTVLNNSKIQLECVSSLNLHQFWMNFRFFWMFYRTILKSNNCMMLLCGSGALDIAWSLVHPLFLDVASSNMPDFCYPTSFFLECSILVQRSFST